MLFSKLNENRARSQVKSTQSFSHGQPVSTKGKRSLFQRTVNALAELWTWALLKEPTAILLLSMNVGDSELSLSSIGGFCGRIFFITRLHQMFHVIIVHPTVSVTMKDLKKITRYEMVVKLMSSFEKRYQKVVLKFRTGIAWEKSRHFATSSTVVSEVWGTSTESPNWWRVTS